MSFHREGEGEICVIIHIYILRKKPTSEYVIQESGSATLCESMADELRDPGDHLNDARFGDCVWSSVQKCRRCEDAEHHLRSVECLRCIKERRKKDDGDQIG